MINQFSRSELIYGKDAIETLKGCRVAVFGVGGVGGYVVEALARAGIGALDIIDNDNVSLTNINRQIIATHDTIGESKVAVCELELSSSIPTARCEDTRCSTCLKLRSILTSPSTTIVVDAVDTVSAKLDIIERCKSVGVPIISCMGCGNRIDPTKLAIMDIAKTSMDPLAKVIRKGLKDRRIKGVKVLCSTEEPIVPSHPRGRSG